ncbi:beta-lactamase/transpeptidase-like protein [Aaosphaeria arxii CBS 175.79]|uniref:Beta-lactamase/transpeptidase-like protein n=1 Tax=Aaosphaeria arxii CBS 175.79 TaxID=1450172 RepID=A0A6A5XS45_9PLEO|nr:beta-lactamase/transpeptidase-like protein [Aaosphaeria arxii CBS 175.79]KAF2016155.1 beta-lactamase/transpeptidase-like protein [Aaosphaeria arxii CBS 175.79]
MSSSLAASVDGATTSSNPTQLGIVVTAVNSQGEIVISHSSGKTSLKPDAIPITVGSIYRLASATKIITSIAALRLVQSGKLSLDDASLIERHLPEMWSQEIFTSVPGQLPFTYKKRQNPITLRHLLSHTSGSGADILDPRLMAWRKERGEQCMTLTGAVVEGNSTPGLFEPGEGWSYGGGLNWTGLLIERVSGVRLGQFLRKEVFDVLGCDERIGFEGELEGKEKVMLVTKAKKGEALREVPPVPVRAELGGGALLSSTANFVKILQDIINPTSKLLETKWLDELFAPQLQSAPSLKALQGSVPMFSPLTGPLTSSVPLSAVNHGLGGLLITEDSSELGKTKGTLAWGGAFNCVWFANRQQGIAGYYASSIFPPGDPETSGFWAQFVREAWGKAGGGQ